MIRLLEPELLLKCRREDLQMVKEMLNECQQQFQDIMFREATVNSEITYSTKLNLVETEFMSVEQGGECGGIVLTSMDKRIVCNNTLKFRLDLCFEELLPNIRRLLFPVKKSPV